MKNGILKNENFENNEKRNFENNEKRNFENNEKRNFEKRKIFAKKLSIFD